MRLMLSVPSTSFIVSVCHKPKRKSPFTNEIKEQEDNSLRKVVYMVMNVLRFDCKTVLTLMLSVHGFQYFTGYFTDFLRHNLLFVEFADR